METLKGFPFPSAPTPHPSPLASLGLARWCAAGEAGGLPTRPTMQRWIEVQIETHADAADLVAAAVAPTTGGVELRDAETLLSVAAGRTCVVALCQPDRAGLLLDAVEEALGEVAPDVAEHAGDGDAGAALIRTVVRREDVERRRLALEVGERR